MIISRKSPTSFATQEYSVHIVHIYSFVHLLMSSLNINPLPPILFYCFDALHISFPIECLLCFNKKIELKLYFKEFHRPETTEQAVY